MVSFWSHLDAKTVRSRILVVDTEDRYEFEGLALTGAILRDQILERWAGQSGRRRLIVSDCLEDHIRRGGLPPNARDFEHSSAVTRAFQTLEKDGSARQIPGHGQWEILVPEGAEAVEVQEEPEEEPEVEAEIELGEGSRKVYAFYYPTYRAYAETSGEERWPIKIGRTRTEDRTVRSRVEEQIRKTAIPELPVVGLIIHCDDSSNLEKGIHSVLRVRGQNVKDATGDEWFLTSVAEVVELAESIRGEAIQPTERLDSEP